MGKASIAQMWEEFKIGAPNAPESYEAWAFGDSKEMADELAGLVLSGKKTGTSSNYLLYELESETLPHVGLHNIILDGEGQAVAVVETTSVEVVRFDEVTEEHAHSEGEGDCSLRYWREVHQDFFERELESVKQHFHDKIPVVCERFKVVFKKNSSIVA
nr:ASCH domain-containing protein [Sporosarcina sp.]